jgi:phosphatidate cytidylyltransferase
MASVLGLAFAFGEAGIVMVFALLSLAALREFPAITPQAGPERVATLSLFLVGLPVQSCLIWADWHGLFAIFLTVYAYLPLSLAAAIAGPQDYLQRMATLAARGGSSAICWTG